MKNIYKTTLGFFIGALITFSVSAQSIKDTGLRSDTQSRIQGFIVDHGCEEFENAEHNSKISLFNAEYTTDDQGDVILVEGCLKWDTYVFNLKGMSKVFDKSKKIGSKLVEGGKATRSDPVYAYSHQSLNINTGWLTGKRLRVEFTIIPQESQFSRSISLAYDHEIVGRVKVFDVSNDTEAGQIQVDLVE